MKQVRGNKPLIELDDDDITFDIEPVKYEWRRMHDEKKIYYSYFKAYVAMPHPRRISRIAKQLRFAENTVRMWAGKYRWRERAEKYDAHYLEKELEIKRQLHEKTELEWLERRQLQRQQEWDIAQNLLDKVRKMLAVPLFQETINTKMKGLDKHGRIILEQVIINKPLDWSPSDIAKFFEVASKIARLATGQETDRKKIKIDFGKLSDEELDNLLNE
jgi:hypothetical protein